MSSNTSGGIASTTLVCSLGMSVVDKASAKFKGNKRSLAKQSQVTSNCGLMLALVMRLPSPLTTGFPRPLPAAYFSRAKEKQKP